MVAVFNSDSRPYNRPGQKFENENFCFRRTPALVKARGVQYVHWVMHKCIMVKVGGKRNTHKVFKKQVIFSETGGKFIKVGGNNNFRETEGGNVEGKMY